MSRGPGRVQRRIVDVLGSARTVEPWPVWMTVYGLTQRVYDIEAVSRAQVESVRRACKAAANVEWSWSEINVTSEHGRSGAVGRWIGKARLTPAEAEAVLWKAWDMPPIVRNAHPDTKYVDIFAPVDAPWYTPPDRDLLADALAWHLIKRTVKVDKAAAITLFNAYSPDRPFNLDDYAQPCYVCGTPTTRATKGSSAYPDCGAHITPSPACYSCGRRGLPGSGTGNTFFICTECATGTVDALAMANGGWAA